MNDPTRLNDDEEKDKVIHEVDGIQEYDNKLPNWWLYTLYGAVAFATIYWFHYHVGAFGDSSAATYQAEVDAETARAAARVKAAGLMSAEALSALARDRATVDQGKQVFEKTCAACHRQDGGGVVGPNLTDDYWIHGGAPDRVFRTITEGVPDKGMPAWGPQLGADRVQAVAAYVISLRNTNVPGGKAPQGERESLSLR
jgi:cytochrome c oxidase cbb3-type subunit III